MYEVVAGREIGRACLALSHSHCPTATTDGAYGQRTDLETGAAGPGLQCREPAPKGEVGGDCAINHRCCHGMKLLPLW